MEVYQTPVDGNYFKLTENLNYFKNRGFIVDFETNKRYETILIPYFNKTWVQGKFASLDVRREILKNQKDDYKVFKNEKMYKEDKYGKWLEEQRDGTRIIAYDLNNKPEEIKFIGSFHTTANLTPSRNSGYTRNNFKNMAVKHGVIDSLVLYIHVLNLEYYKSFPEEVFNLAFGYIKEVPENFLIEYNGVWIFEALLNHFGRLHFQEKL